MNKNLPHIEEAGGNMEYSSSQRPSTQPYLLQTSNVEHITQAFLALNKQGYIIYISQQAAQILEQTREALMGKCIWEVFPEMAGSPLHHHCRQAVASGKATQFQIEAPRYSKWFHIHIFPSPDEIAIFFSDITEHKRAIEQLRFQALIENSVDAIALVDASGKIRYTSPSVTRTMGYLPGELLGYTASELVHPDDLEQLRNIFSSIMQEAGKSVYTEFRVRHKNGTYRWMRGNGLNLLHDPAVAALVINYHDITDHKRSIEERQRLAAIVKSSDDAIIGLDKEGIITSWNREAERIYGYTAEEAIGKPISFLGQPDQEDEFTTLLEKILQGESIDHFETLRQRKNRTTITVSVSASPIRDDTGTITGIASIVHDITKQKQLEAEIRQARQQLEIILQNIADGILVQDTTGTIIYANHKAATLAGYTSAEEILQTPESLYWEQFEITDEEGHSLPLSQLPAGRVVEKKASSQVNVRLVLRRTREVRWVSIKTTAVLAGEQVSPLVISVLQDITQFKELEQHKDEFIMHVSHELRTPLAAVSGYLELLQDHGERLDAKAKAQFLHQALENCQVLAELVNTVINVLKIKQDAKPIKSEQLAVASIVREVIEQFDPRTWQEYHCQLDIPEDLCVYADKQYLCQVLRNLISNAFKYAPKQTPLIISATPIAQEAGAVPQVCISVQDAGPGIPPAEQPLLFQKFLRLKRDLNSTIRGTGLGLYICKEVVEKMDGRIWIESSGKEGEGSRFSFTLPAARA